MRLAILFRMLARSVVEVLPHAVLALCAASRARLTSAAVDLGISQKALPVTGVMFSKYWLPDGVTHSPPMKLP